MSEYKTAPYTFRKDGIFYFIRRVPADLSSHYSSSRISYSLRTRSRAVASARSTQAACKLDEFWFHLRSKDADLPGQHLLKHGLTQHTPTPKNASVNESTATLSEGVLTYLKLKGRNRPEGFRRTAERSCGYVIDVCGDKPLNKYTKADANAFRDALIERGLAGSSISRVIGSVRSMFNFAASEEGLSLTNPFSKIYYDRTAGITDRVPISIDGIRQVQQTCFDLDDELRWLVALVSDTGMRLAEAVGMLRDDIQTDENGQLVVQITPHPWRRLKTRGSERVVPLVGASEWAARRILAQRQPGDFAFPRYNKTSSTNANSASAALNKWMKPMVPDGASMHSFRHSMRDRLRAV
jgi:integrase